MKKKKITIEFIELKQKVKQKTEYLEIEMVLRENWVAESYASRRVRSILR